MKPIEITEIEIEAPSLIVSWGGSLGHCDRKLRDWWKSHFHRPFLWMSCEQKKDSELGEVYVWSNNWRILRRKVNKDIDVYTISVYKPRGRHETH